MKIKRNRESGVTMKEFSNTYKLLRETKGTYVYQYVRPNGRKEAHYVNKEDLQGSTVPQEIKVTVQWKT